MPDQFPYDVFLSHSAKDKAVIRPLAERLRKDRVKVWFDEWVLKPGDSIPAKIEEGLERSRVLVLCTSANAFGSDWAQLESGTFRFRDPLNKERRFLPLRLDNAPIKGTLAQFLYINWLTGEREQEYAKLLEACRPILTRQIEAVLSQPLHTRAVIREEFFAQKQPKLIPRIHAVQPNPGQVHLFCVHLGNQGTATADQIQISVRTSEIGLPYFSPGFWRMGSCHAPYTFETAGSINPERDVKVFMVGFQQDPEVFAFDFEISARDQPIVRRSVRFSRDESSNRLNKEGGLVDV